MDEIEEKYDFMVEMQERERGRYWFVANRWAINSKRGVRYPAACSHSHCATPSLSAVLLYKSIHQVYATVAVAVERVTTGWSNQMRSSPRLLAMLAARSRFARKGGKSPPLESRCEGSLG